jgi:hypothetical protein
LQTALTAFLLAHVTCACALEGRPGLLTTRLVGEDDGSSTPGDPSRPISLRGNLQMAVGSRAVLKVAAFAFSGKRSLLAFRSPALPASSPGAALIAGGGAGLVGSAPTLSRDRANSDQAYAYRLDYSSSRLQLSGSVMDVGARFAPTEGSNGEDLEMIKRAVGSQALNLKAVWQLSPAASFTSERTSVRTDKPGDEKNGLAAVDMVHSVALNLGNASKLTASIGDHDEQWDAGLGKPDLHRRTTRTELQSQLGGGRGEVRLALTSVNTRTGDQTTSQTTREWHVKLQPHAKLSLSADSVGQENGQGHGQTSSAVAAVLNLAQNSQLSATVKNTSPAQGSGTRETNLQFTGGLGHGSSAFTLAASTKTVRSDASGALANNKLSLAGGFGQGATRTNLSANLEQQRSSSATGPLTKAAVLHLDRAFGSRLRLSADREQKLTGTAQSPQAARRSAATLTARLGPRTEVTASVNAQDQDGAASRCSRDLVLEQGLGRARLRAERHLLQIGPDGQDNMRHALEMPMGELPEWAKNAARAHQFQEAYDYLTPKEAGWLEAPLFGLRLSTRRWQGGPDDGRTSLAITHGRMVARRYYLQYTYQQSPEGTDGDRKDRPLDVARQAMVLAAPLRQKLTGRCWLAQESNLLDSRSRRRTVGMGLWGQLSDQKQVEATVAHDSATWEGADRDRTSVSLLYSQRVSDEHKLSLKLGYAWGECLPGSSATEYRAILGYDKPI